jgi:hypothetical protein
MGLALHAEQYRQDIREVALVLIKAARPIIELPTSEVMRGARFNDDLGVLWRLESMTKENDFVHDPILGISNALVDAAQSDFWYEHEKDYGNEDTDVEDYECEE